MQFCNPRGYFRAESHGESVLMRDHDAAGLPHAAVNQLFIQWHYGAEVDDFERIAFLLHLRATSSAR
jgi:hypothetical protein